MGNFWDLCAPFYDFFNMRNQTYREMLKTVSGFVPRGVSVLEIAAGTGAISRAVSGQASTVLCTDISEKMLAVAKKKTKKSGAKNIVFENMDIFETGKPEESFDVVIASQILHLIDNPEKAAAELRRLAKDSVILPMSFTKNLAGISKMSVGVYRLFGFSPKIEMEPNEYAGFLQRVGFAGCEIIHIDGGIPVAVAVWKKR